MLLSNFTLLFVEDDNNLIEVMKPLLRHFAKEVYLANNGRDGLELYKEKKPDIVLTDIYMPIMNGIDMAYEIKQISPRQPIAIITALDDVEILKKALNIGIEKYIIKPVINMESFIESLESIAKILQADIDRKKLQNMYEIHNKVMAQQELIGNIAHHWRQPLNIISVSASSIKLKLELDDNIIKEELIDSYNEIIKQTQFMSKTIEDCRDLFTGDEDSKGEFSLSKAINSAISINIGLFESNFITVKTNYEEDVILNQDKSQFVQALLNIFHNSKEAFLLNQIKTEDRYIFINVKKEEENTILSIKDSAGGIKENIINKIFEPYFTTKHPSIGIGLSLYMTYKTIVDKMNGNIIAQNVKFKYMDRELSGAEFKIVLGSSC